MKDTLKNFIKWYRVTTEMKGVAADMVAEIYLKKNPDLVKPEGKKKK